MEYVGRPSYRFENDEGEYEIEVDEDIDLSAEYDVQGKLTTYTWKNEDGDVITPTSADATGWFCFGSECVGKVYRCEMQNAAYPALALNTVWVKVVDSYSTGVNKTESVKIKVGPNPVVNELSVVASDVRSIDVYSTTGACVKRANGSQTIVNVSDLTPGLYFVKVTTSTSEDIVKIIKK